MKCRGDSSAIATVAKRLRASWDEAAGIQARAVHRGLARHPATPARQPGIDETALARRHRYVTTARVLDVADDRRQENLDALWPQLSAAERQVQARRKPPNRWQLVEATRPMIALPGPTFEAGAPATRGSDAMPHQDAPEPRDDLGGAAGVPAWRNLFEGGFGSLGLFLLSGAVILACLFATVHHQRLTTVAAQAGPARDRHAIMFWITEGYFRHGGLVLMAGAAGHPAPYFHSNSTGGYLQGLHLLQRLYYSVAGDYSYTLTALHNQVVVMISAVLLGLLALRLARRTGVNAFHATCLGLACTLVYQTFPKNLVHYWLLTPQLVFVLFLVLFLLIEEIGFEQGALSRAGRLIRAAAVFGLVDAEHIGGVFFLAVYFVAAMILRSPWRPDLRRALEFLAPAALAIGLYVVQLLWVHYAFPSIDILGSSFTFRSGLDGATTYYKDHFDLLYGRRLSFPYPAYGNAEVNDWQWLFVAGVVAILILAWNYPRTPVLRRPVWILIIALGPYVLYAFLFSQSVVIHSELYDISLALPLTLAVFGVLPSWGETRTGYFGLPVFLAVMAALCYAPVQIHAYSAMFPRG